MKSKKLMVIIPDELSVLSSKGELIDRYYNPGDYFEEVHIVMTNKDNVKIQEVQKSVGTAKLYIHNIFTDKKLLFTSLGYRPLLLKKWARKGIDLAKKIKPDLIRCHDNRLNGYVACRIKKELGIKYVVSMHRNPDIDESFRLNPNIIYYLYAKSYNKIENMVIKNADAAISVYDAISSYINRLKPKRHELIYNVINPSYLRKKIDYQLHNPIKLLCVGRQRKQKNPDNIIRAISKISNIEFTLIGRGPYHKHLINVAKECEVSDRINFIESMSNDEICDILPQFDIFTAHIDYWGIPKSILEPLLTGLPVVVNQNSKFLVKEYEGSHIKLVDNTVESYYNAFNELIINSKARKQLGENAYRIAQALWNPEKNEKAIVKLYKDVLEGKNEKCNK